MKWFIIGGEDINVTDAFIEGALLNFDIKPKDITEIVTTLRGGVDLMVEEFALIQEIECITVSPNWSKDSVEAPTLLASEICAAVDRVLIISDGEYAEDDFLCDVFAFAKADGVVVHEVILATNV